jgi:hypothetical protein
LVCLFVKKFPPKRILVHLGDLPFGKPDLLLNFFMNPFGLKEEKPCKNK